MAYAGIEVALESRQQMDHVGKPVPDQADPLTAPFWKAASEERLVIQRCQNCKTYHHPPLGICWSCLSTDLKFEEVSGRGRVYSYAIVRDQRLPAFDSLIPYIAATVALDEAPDVTLATNLPGTSIDEVQIDLKVHVEFDEIAPGIKIPQFRDVTVGGDA